jgi:rod shape-determining protein MreC
MRADNPVLFTESVAGTLRLIAYLALAVVLMTLDHRAGYLQTLRRTASAVVEPLYRLAGLPTDLARATRTAVISQSRLAEENRELRQQLLFTRAQVNRLSALAAQNARLKDLLEAQRALGLEVQLARLIDVDLDPSRHRVVLDAGSLQGVVVGQPVIDAHGVMGQVVETLPNTSVAMLITDPNHALPVLVERTGLRTIAYGGGAIDRLTLPNIPISADVRVGDRLVTSGMGGRFPAGFPVGTLRRIGNDASGLFAVGIVTPAASLDRSSEVLLLRDQPEPFGPPEEAPEYGPPVEPRTATDAAGP